MTTCSHPETLSLLPETESQPKTFSLGVTGEVHGAGSTTTAKLLAEILGFDYEYAGDYRRRLAVKSGYAEHFEDDAGVARFDSEIAPLHPNTDYRLDAKIIRKATKGGCVFEGKAAVVLAKAALHPTRNSGKKAWRLAPVDSPLVFSILLTCDESTAAKRILLRKKLHQEDIDPSTVSLEKRQKIMAQFTPEEVTYQTETSQKRMAANRQNWEKAYGFSEIERGEGAYDLTIDTTSLTPEQVVVEILQELFEKPNLFSILSDAQRKRVEDFFS